MESTRFFCHGLTTPLTITTHKLIVYISLTLSTDIRFILCLCEIVLISLIQRTKPWLMWNRSLLPFTPSLYRITLHPFLS
ncbi:hypothetical protein Pint_03643 [Pistacia integerrima]|uniref:Uncharacterized protein n=1 Tax=Pistacia integerrima TaxID=434235 RepID=A0ACC0Z7W7_9ROSI|nr:hypothetical protein Pint_03643 [Pistacia integerrima]